MKRLALLLSTALSLTASAAEPHRIGVDHLSQCVGRHTVVGKDRDAARYVALIQKLGLRK